MSTVKLVEVKIFKTVAQELWSKNENSEIFETHPPYSHLHHDYLRSSSPFTLTVTADMSYRYCT